MRHNEIPNLSTIPNLNADLFIEAPKPKYNSKSVVRGRYHEPAPPVRRYYEAIPTPDLSPH